ncbi:unnamed protein product [Rotaria sp. Silwood1]|nr:unnamed protein product [Rotaria sp. Silwood1]CAF3723970.1 unnamed protein product [Rotaria sp. Silwood1]CAF4534453.1 unnamed protein product [Rotaria sp. Silwood1]CAF4725001.1 unnamed protein product [Rotaria sp. Silwood1]
MDDSMINSILLPSSVHLENLEKLIKNLEKQTFNIDNFEKNILNNDNKQEIITKSYSSLSSSTIPMADISNENFLIKSITLTNDVTIADHNHESFSMDSLSTQRDLFSNDDFKKEKISIINDQSLCNDQDSGFTWDDQYDTQTNYCRTFDIDKLEEIDLKSEKSFQYEHQTINQKPNSTYSDDNILSNVMNTMNDWSMKSDLNNFEQSINQSQQIHCQFNLSSSLYEQKNSNNNNSSGSSTSWRQMKQNQQTPTEIKTRETRPLSPINLYKIFQQKSNTITPSSRSIFQLCRSQNDSISSNLINKTIIEKSKRSQSHSTTDQAIQTSILADSSTNSQCQTVASIGSKSKSYDNLTLPFSIPSSSIHKSLPDLSFISQYSKELPRSYTASLLPRTSSLSINFIRTTSSPTLIQQQKHDSDRPRTLKSIKRYKNSKHSTEPIGVFYSPQLRKTFAAVPTSAVINGSNTSATVIKMKLPSSSSLQSEQQQTVNLKSCLKYQSRANSCDIQSTLHDKKSPILSCSIPRLTNNKDINFPSLNHHCSKIDTFKSSDVVYSSNSCSNNFNIYQQENSSREHHSEYDLLLLIEQKNQTKKSVSFSENISKHLRSSCNPTIIFDENKERLTKRTMIRHDEMRRCQTDIIHIDPVLHLHSLTDSPPNEFCLQQDEDDKILMENSHINIISNLDEVESINTNVSSSPLNSSKIHSIEKETISSNQSLISKNTSILDDLLERIIDIIKRLFEIKQSDKSFFLNNENNLQLDSLLKNDFCTAIQNILEHGRKDFKKITLWKIIELSISPNSSSSFSSRQVPEVYYEAKQIAHNISSHWLYRFQAFIFVLLNKNELINWLYYFTRQKDIIQYYYQSPDALILVSIPSTFNLFERIMTQLEKLTPIAFQLTYHIPNDAFKNDDQLNTSMISMHSTKTTARNWLMSISRRTSRNLTQSIIQDNSNDTLRSTLSKKFNSFFTRTNTQQVQQQKKPTSVVTTKLPESKQQIISTEQSRRPHIASIFNNSFTTNKPSIVPNEKFNDSIVRNVSSSTSSMGMIATFQSKISRPSLNIDTPKSTRYHTTIPLSK